MPLPTKAGLIHNASTTTGRKAIELPTTPSMTLLFVSISGGTATVVLEISDDNSLFIPVATITSDAAVQFAIPASVLAANITQISGATVTVRYRTVVLTNMPAQTLLVYDTTQVSDPVVPATQTFISGDVSARKKLAQVQPGTTPTTLYTVPASKVAEIVHIRVVNPTGASHTIKLWHDGSADVNLILPTVTIDAGGWGEFDGRILMETGDTLVAQADAASAVTATVYGFELQA